LAAESRSPEWIVYWYVWPSAVREIWRRLEESALKGAIIGLVGRQGVGKSSALLALVCAAILLGKGKRESKKSVKEESNVLRSEDLLHFKWRRHQDLFQSLLNGTHELSKDFRRQYSLRLLDQLKPHLPFIYQSQLDAIKAHPETLNFDWAEKKLGKQITNALREVVWLDMFLTKKLVLIDTPDYSKTDRRLMARDLEEIYWLWNSITNCNRQANIVLAIQKEMFHDHFFFDKMQKIELRPLQPEEIVEAYKKRFKTTDPFTNDALLTLARMSRGIFRRFLRYITLALDFWQLEHGARGDHIDIETVKRAVTTERLAEDMELELSDLFPKHSDLRFQAVQLLAHLEEQGSQKQSELANSLGMEAYSLSRLLTKLEHSRYVTRTREATDKIVSLRM
jgi:hypothetical protein